MRKEFNSFTDYSRETPPGSFQQKQFSPQKNHRRKIKIGQFTENPVFCKLSFREVIVFSERIDFFSVNLFIFPVNFFREFIYFSFEFIYFLREFIYFLWIFSEQKLNLPWIFCGELPCNELPCCLYSTFNGFFIVILLYLIYGIHFFDFPELINKIDSFSF
jgi:hypothetical protein